MTVAELIEILKKYPADSKVFIDIAVRYKNGYMKAKAPLQGFSFLFKELTLIGDGK